MLCEVFDIWNTCSFEEADRKRKPNLEAFCYDYDERLKVYKLYIMLCTTCLAIYSRLEDTSMKYLDDWEDSVQKMKTYQSL